MRHLVGAVILSTGLLLISQNSTTVLDLTDGLVLYWSFDTGEGDIVFDLSGKGNDGALKSGAQWVEEGLFGGAVKLEGGALVEAPLSSSLKIRDAITIAAWVYFIQAGQRANNYLGTDKYRLISGWDRDARIECFIEGQWHRSATRSFAISENTWTHLIGTYDKDSRALRIYINGELKMEQILLSNGDPRILESTSSFQIGNWPRKADPPYNRIWLVDEVRIYNRALSKEEVKELFQMGQRE